MKLRIVVLALFAALGCGCTSMDKPRRAMEIQPLLSIRHGAPNAQAYYQLGRYYQGQLRQAQAEAAYLKAIAADDHHVDAYNALGSLYAERGELERSTKMFERVTAMAPDAAYLYSNLGFAYYLQGRFDEAYAAMRKALSLDDSLQRGWVNLERIAAKRPDPMLLAAIKARRLEALPSEFSATVIADQPTAEPAQIAVDPGPLPTLTLDSGPAMQTPTQAVMAVDTARASLAEQPSTLVPSSENLIAGGKFVLVSATREVVANGGSIDIAMTESAPRGDTGIGDMPIPVPVARLEVSNGNGVARFAREFSAQLRGDNIPVTRITNLGSYSLKQSVIEYQPGYEQAARALMLRTKLAVRLIAAIKPRPGSDIRLVLGQDAVKPS